MEQALSAQLLLLAATLLVGLGLGAVYELLRVLRERSGLVFGILLDLHFCCCFAAALFLLGMGPGAGRLRLYMPPLALLGVWLWGRLFGAPERKIVRRALDLGRRALGVLLRPLRLLLRPLKKIRFFCKKVFSFFVNCVTMLWYKFIIIHNSATDDAEAAKETAYEIQTRQHLYKDRDPRADRVRRDQPDRNA